MGHVQIHIFTTAFVITISLLWRHNDCDGVSNHQPYDCLLNRLFRRRWKKTSKVRFTGLCAGNSPVTGEFPAQMASNAENVSIWWRYHDQNEWLCQATFICVFRPTVYHCVYAALCRVSFDTCRFFMGYEIMTFWVNNGLRNYQGLKKSRNIS